MADTFTVTGITNTVYSEPGKLAGPALEVAFVTIPSDIRGSVVIPQALFTIEEAQRLVEREAATLEAVMRL